MAEITDADIRKLATLARIEVADEKVPQLKKEMSAILAYVSELDAVAGEERAPSVGPVHNVFREDDAKTATPAGTNTERLLEQVSSRKGDHLKVTKILQSD